MEILAFIVSLNSSSSIVCWINLQFGCKIQLKCWCKKRNCLNGLFWIHSFGCWSIRIITLAFKIIQPIPSSLHMLWTLWISFHYYVLIRWLIFGFCRISLLNICRWRFGMGNSLLRKIMLLGRLSFNNFCINLETYLSRNNW